MEELMIVWRFFYALLQILAAAWGMAFIMDCVMVPVYLIKVIIK